MVVSLPFMNSILRWCFKLQQSVAKTMRSIRGVRHGDGEAQYSEELGLKAEIPPKE